MSDSKSFIEEIQEGYNFEGESIALGAAMLNDETFSDATVKVPLKTLNRHGLIAGCILISSTLKSDWL